MPESNGWNQKSMPKSESNSTSPISAVDLFCGAGGLTKGLEKVGVPVRLGVDVDQACAYPYEANNGVRFLRKSVEKLSAAEVLDAMDGVRYRLLAGCAPCQPFSTYRQGQNGIADDRWNLLRQFARLVRETQPDLVTMENVPRLAKQAIFEEFVGELRHSKFHVSFQVVQCADYGVPQRRERLVLLASRLGPIGMIAPTHAQGKHRTVRDAIGGLPPIEAGETHPRDPLHQACSLTPLNLKRIKTSRPGGTWRDWDERLIAECHKRGSGKKYSSIYGRMSWDLPAPTLTTQFYNFGSGRYGHPEQDRAISFREGAIIQGFPRSYRFFDHGERIGRHELGRLIGNAVPVKLGEAIGKSVLRHVAEFG